MSDNKAENGLPNPTFDKVDSTEIESGELATVPLSSPLTDLSIAPFESGPSTQQIISGAPDPNGSSSQAVLHAAAQQEMQQQAVAVDMHKLQIETETAKITAIAAERTMVQQRALEQCEVVTDLGNMFVRKRTVYEQFAYRELVQEIYIEYKEQPKYIEGGPDPDIDPEVTPTKFEKGIDYCCQSCTCNFQNPFRRQREKPMVQKKELMTPILRRGRAKGWSMYNHFAFPFVGDVVRVVWIICELVLAFFGTIFSIATFSAGSNASFNIFHLILSLLSAVLAIFDAFYSLSTSCHNCIKNCKGQSTQTDNGETGSQSSNEKPDKEDTVSFRKCSCACCKRCKTCLDIARTALTELILVPLLICDIFEVVTGAPTLGEDPSNVLGIVLFAIGCIGVVLYVYVVRLCILIGMVYYVQSARTPTTNSKEEQEKVNYDPSYKKYALIFQVFFVIHVAGQMIGQIFMLIAIGGKIRFDNRHLYGESKIDTTTSFGLIRPPIAATESMAIHSSPELIYMCIAVTILPVCGFLSFFIVTNFWVQEFPISLCIDVIKILQMPGAEDILDYKEVAKEKAHEMCRAISEFVRVEKLTKEYNGLRNTAFLDKLFHPFKSPGLVILCLLYAGGQLGFVICAATATIETGQVLFQILNGGGWVVYYIIAVIVGIIANVYAFAIAAVWITIIAGILALIALVIGIFCLMVCASTTDRPQQR